MHKSSIKILKEYLHKKGFKISPDDYLCVLNKLANHKLKTDIIDKIIIDATGFHDQILKKISEQFSQEYSFFLGRVQKIQLKKYLDYQEEKDLDKFLNLSQLNITYKKIFINYINDIKKNQQYKQEYKKNIDSFLSLVRDAIKSKNKKRVTDYLNFMYSRLVSINENSNISVTEIFDQNKDLLSTILNEEELKKFTDLCYSKSNKIENRDAIEYFNTEYLKIMNERKNEKYSLIFLKIDQRLFNQYNNYEHFLSSTLNFIDLAYKDIENHKTLSIFIGDIFYNGLNIKWYLYAYLVVYAEKFKPHKEIRQYYDPSTICIDTLNYKLNIELSSDDKNEIKQFFKNTLSKDKFSKNVLNENINLIKSFQEIHLGFTFRDLFILKKNKPSKNSGEIKFIKNETELLLVFSKHEIYDEKIPCPVCGSLKVSGNSFPEIGVRSWECKNHLCLERSKTNRGKRFSERTVIMQKSNHNFSKENIIGKDLIKQWRKDVVEKWSEHDLFLMLIKYFTYSGDKILAINLTNTSIKKIDIMCHNQKRLLFHQTFKSYVKENNRQIVSTFEGGDFFNKLFHLKDKNNSIFRTKNIDIKNHSIINDDALEVLGSMEKDSIPHMVTSPPYFNAREYSKWPNLFCYINDMHLINKEAFKCIKKGGVYFYNIGDIFDNENTIVKSKMGEKRVPLGAYTILSFITAGYQLIDNIIWYKGESQSNRHKNDGNFTPYYQKPANCYEHMFIFKKPGNKIHINNESKEIQLKSNINKFTPVFKIGKGGTNNYGHTAPYPQVLPNLSISTFTNKGDTVFDPFLGSGTTIISASKLGRIGFGTELNKNYCELCFRKTKEEGINCLKF